MVAAYEVQAADIAATKADGLRRHYGVDPQGTRFWDVHAGQEVEHAVKDLGHRGASIGGHVNGEPLTLPKFDPFWAKVEQLGVPVKANAPAAAEPASTARREIW